MFTEQMRSDLRWIKEKSYRTTNSFSGTLTSIWESFGEECFYVRGKAVLSQRKHQKGIQIVWKTYYYLLTIYKSLISAQILSAHLL